MGQPALWLRGAEGECRTAVVLDSLTDDYVVFHDFHPRGRDGGRISSNIDHIVVGPTGIFVIDSKNHGRSSVESADASKLTKQHVSAVSHQALTVRGWLKSQSDDDIRGVYVNAILVHVSRSAVVRKIQEHQVSVLPLRMLMKHLIVREKKMTTQQVAKIRRVLLQKRSSAPQLRQD